MYPKPLVAFTAVSEASIETDSLTTVLNRLESPLNRHQQGCRPPRGGGAAGAPYGAGTNRLPQPRQRCPWPAGERGCGRPLWQGGVRCVPASGVLIRQRSTARPSGRGPCRAFGRGPPPSDRTDTGRGGLPADLAAPSRRSIVVAGPGPIPGIGMVLLFSCYI